MTPKFTRRHYRAIAKAMKDCSVLDTLHGRLQWKSCVLALSHLFSTDNPRFSSGKFEEACK